MNLCFILAQGPCYPLYRSNFSICAPKSTKAQFRSGFPSLPLLATLLYNLPLLNAWSWCLPCQVSTPLTECRQHNQDNVVMMLGCGPHAYGTVRKTPSTGRQALNSFSLVSIEVHGQAWKLIWQKAEGSLQSNTSKKPRPLNCKEMNPVNQLNETLPFPSLQMKVQ